MFLVFLKSLSFFSGNIISGLLVRGRIHNKFFSSLKDSDQEGIQSGVVYHTLIAHRYNHRSGIADGIPYYSALVRPSLQNPPHAVDFNNIHVFDRESK
jgi:hypothetical protein